MVAALMRTRFSPWLRPDQAILVDDDRHNFVADIKDETEENLEAFFGYGPVSGRQARSAGALPPPSDAARVTAPLLQDKVEYAYPYAYCLCMEIPRALEGIDVSRLEILRQMSAEGYSAND